jgi:transcription elongation factor Elf1
MSVQLDTTWTCAACELKQSRTIKKPTALTPVIVKAECKDCKSRFLFSVKKVAGQLSVMWTVIDYELTKAGKAKQNLRHQEKVKPNPPRLGSAETIGV